MDLDIAAQAIARCRVVVSGYRKGMASCGLEGRSTISRLILIAGDHSMLVTRLVGGRRAGRFALAYRFHGVWRFVTDVDTDELLTWKTEEEALIIGDAWRHAWETIKFPAPEKAKRRR